MKIVVPIKVLADDQDIVATRDGSLDDSKAHCIVSAYDLNAIEVAVQLAAKHEGSHVVAISVADAKADDSKLKKSILSRGVDELVLIADDATKDFDAYQTAASLASLIKQQDADMIICGDGSADLYAQQVDVQLAAALDLPVATACVSAEVNDGVATCDRMLETQVETVEVELPVVVSVVPDAALPRIPGMKDILAAGKKPSQVCSVENAVDPAIEIVSTRAPEHIERKLEVFDASAEGDIDKFVVALKAAL